MTEPRRARGMVVSTGQVEGGSGQWALTNPSRDRTARYLVTGPWAAGCSGWRAALSVVIRPGFAMLRPSDARHD